MIFKQPNHASKPNWCHSHVYLADDVEFEVSSDRRTGKPIAIKLVKIKPEILPEERINGQVSAYFPYVHNFHPSVQELDSLNMHINYTQLHSTVFLLPW